MKESEKILQRCIKLEEEFKECFLKEGYKARYLGWCTKQNLRLTKCKMEHFEQQRREHNEESLRFRRKRLLEQKQ